MKFLLLYLFKRPVRRNGKMERNVKRQKYLKNNVRTIFRVKESWNLQLKGFIKSQTGQITESHIHRNRHSLIKFKNVKYNCKTLNASREHRRLHTKRRQEMEKAWNNTWKLLRINKNFEPTISYPIGISSYQVHNYE